MSSPWLGPRPPAEPPALPTVDCTAERASGLMAATCGAISPSIGAGRLGPRLLSPLNGDVLGPLLIDPPLVSSAAQCRSGGSAEGMIGRIWPVSRAEGGGPRRPPSNGDGPVPGVPAPGPGTAGPECEEERDGPDAGGRGDEPPRVGPDEPGHRPEVEPLERGEAESPLARVGFGLLDVQGHRVAQMYDVAER